MKNKRGKKTVFFAAFIVVLALFIAAWCLWPLSEDSRKKACTLVESCSCSVLTVDGKPIVYIGAMDKDGSIGMFSLHPDSSSCSRDSALGYWSRRFAVLPGFKGQIVARIKPATRALPRPANLHDFVSTQKEKLDSISKILQYQKHELNYYLHSHSVVDYGYNRIADFSETINHRLDSINQLLKALKIINGKSRLAIKTVTKYYVKGDSSRLILCKLIKIYKNGDRLLRPESTPDSVSLRMTRFQARYWLKRLKPFRAVKPKDMVKLDDGVYYGQLDSVGKPSGEGRCFGDDGSYYEGFWKDGERNGYGFSLRTDKPLRVGEWKSDRYQGERLVYSGNRIYGIDISKHQHIKGRHRYGIDFSQLRISHLGSQSNKQIEGTADFAISYIYIKSTEGASIMNPYYRQDYAAARKYGFHVGTYHFFSVRSSATQQAQFFLRNSRFSKGDFPPVLDLEPLPSQVRRMGGREELFARVRRWLRIVEQHTGVKPILYVSQQFVNRYLSSAHDILHNYPVWIARYGEYKPEVKLVFWQLAPDGRCKGIHGAVDINVFNGYKAAFDDFKQKNVIK